MLLYDAQGRSLRRSIGFIPEYREVEEPKHTPVDLVSSDWVDEDSEEIPEEC